jgi:hypothetical protein
MLRRLGLNKLPTAVGGVEMDISEAQPTELRQEFHVPLIAELHSPLTGEWATPRHYYKHRPSYGGR